MLAETKFDGVAENWSGQWPQTSGGVAQGSHHGHCKREDDVQKRQVAIANHKADELAKRRGLFDGTILFHWRRKMLVKCVSTFMMLFEQRRHFHLNVVDLIDMVVITEEMNHEQKCN